MNKPINMLDRINGSGLSAAQKQFLESLYTNLNYSDVHTLADALSRSANNEDSSELLSNSNVNDLFTKIKAMNQGELLGIIKFTSEVAEESGISMAQAAAPAASDEASDTVVEKNEFNIKITNVDGMDKLPAVKYLKELLGVQLTAASALLAKNTILPAADGTPRKFTKEECEMVIAKLGDSKVLTEKI